MRILKSSWKSVSGLGLGLSLAAAFALPLSIVTLQGCSAAQVRAAGDFPNPKMDDTLATSSGKKTAVLAGGCFWGMQEVFEHVKGVTHVSAGYSGGAMTTAKYETVSEGNTGHAESIQVTYDPSKLTYGQLLKVYFAVAHDPTEVNRQGPDSGSQYRSSIFYGDANQQKIAEAYIAQLQQAQVYSKIATQVVPMKGFYAAEGYHQDYAVHNPLNPYIAFNDTPKIEQFQKQLPDLYVAKPVKY